MNEREWKLGNNIVDEVYEYKNLGVLKNYVGSFSSNVTDNIEKTRKKAGMIFSSKFGRRKTNPLVYTGCLKKVYYLFRSRAESYFDFNIPTTAVLPNICEALQKYGLFDYLKLWFETSVFPVKMMKSNCEAKSS